MENHFRHGISVAAILLTGLSAGLFYAWAVSVIPGTKRISDTSYLEVMQVINRAIINPWFILIFFGPVIFMAASAYLQFKLGANLAFWLILIALLVYLIGTIAVTGLGNVPLNDSLDLVQINLLDQPEMSKVRRSYETSWNRFHMIRTICSVVSFLLLLIASQITKHN